MSEDIYSWNQLYAQVPRPGKTAPWALPAVAALGCILSSAVVVLALIHPRWQQWLPWWEPAFTTLAMLTASGLLVGTAAMLTLCHRRHTWTWGDAELARLVWSSETEADAVGVAMLLAPLTMLVHGLGELLGAGRSTTTILAERVVEGAVATVKFRSNIHPELGQVGYGWIIRSRLWPRRWYHLASVIPGGGARILIPKEAMIDLQAKFGEMRGMKRSIPTPPKVLRKVAKLPQRRPKE